MQSCLAVPARRWKGEFLGDSLAMMARSDVTSTRAVPKAREVPQRVRPLRNLIAVGVHIFDSCDLEALGEAAASRERWEFLLTAAPLPVGGGTGSPLNPIATF